MLVCNNEDYRVETTCLNRFEGPINSLRVCMVTGGADTTLVVCIHEKVKAVLSYDMSPLQIHLLHLKYAVAISDLTIHEALGFLTRGEGGRELFIERLKDLLPESSVEFFETAGAMEIENGILRGANDNPFNIIIRKWFLDYHSVDITKWHDMNLAEREKVIYILIHEDDGTTMLAEIKAFFRKLSWFKVLPEMSRVFILSVFDEGDKGGFGKTIMIGLGKIFSDMASGLLPEHDFYIDILVNGGTPTTIPPWLTERGRAILRAKMGCLTTHIGKVDSMPDAVIAGKFDFISLSNIYDMMPWPAAVIDLKSIVAKLLNPTGEICMRRALGNANGLLREAGGVQLEGEALDNFDYNPPFYRHCGSVSSAKFPRNC
jgi:hypothetical protein